MQIGRYEVIRQLAVGGMGEALLARSRHGHMVVLKRPHATGEHAADNVARLRDEAELGRLVFHANLVQTIELLEHDGLPVLVTRHVEGETLSTVMARSAVVSAQEAALVGLDVLSALDVLHNAIDDQGRPLLALHRDVTPRNVMLQPNGRAVLIDLGIAKTAAVRHAHTSAGEMIGTPHYLAPELLIDPSASISTDVYSVAVAMAALLGGVQVHQRSGVDLLLHLSRHPLITTLPPGFGDDLWPWLQRALAVDPSSRFVSARDAAEALRAIVSDEPTARQLLGARVGPAAMAPVVHAPVGAGVELEAQTSVEPTIELNRDSFEPPQPSVSLELGRDPYARLQLPVEPLPPPQRRRWPLAAAAMIAVFVMAAGVLWSKRPPAKAPIVAEPVGSHLLVACAKLSDGEMYAYPTAKGDVIVDQLSLIPVDKRSKVRCISATTTSDRKAMAAINDEQAKQAAQERRTAEAEAEVGRKRRQKERAAEQAAADKAQKEYNKTHPREGSVKSVLQDL